MELFKEELKRLRAYVGVFPSVSLLRYMFRSQDVRKERKALREEGTVKESVPKQVQEEPFSIEEYKDLTEKGSFDTGDPLTTNLYVGNINPKVSVC